jgi:hypothetical protein
MDFTFNLASRLGKRIQIRTTKFNEMHDLLRGMLPAVKTVAEDDDGNNSKKARIPVIAKGTGDCIDGSC